MQLQWKDFKIDLKKFYKFIQQIPNTDGIIATPEYFEIVEKQPLTEVDLQSINEYYDQLTESSELESLNKPYLIQTKYTELRNSLVYKTYDQMSILERKIFLSIELSEEDQDELIKL